MVVRIDVDAVRGAVDPAVYREAEELLADGRLGRTVEVGGGLIGAVHGEGTTAYEVWVGVVGGAFTGECECAASEADPDELCVHAVTLTLAALRDGFHWSSAATAPSTVEVDPEVRRLAEVAATLPIRRLAMLVAEHAVTDRRLETRLLTYAGQLGAPTDPELADVRATVDGLTATDESDPYDAAKAGQQLVEELEVLAQRPATESTLLTVEYAARRWDTLLGSLGEAADDEDFEEIGSALRAVHVRLCAELRPDPDALVERMLDIIEAAEPVTSCLDLPTDYLPVLGPDHVAALTD
ncbi:hypothetical protein [Micromonospora sp. NBC_01796]|uniref:hypothetical protein n=1 Tax=Micromonospora sp. NBC_01796 TaxID=2975987 RepID=UPI002DDBF677|nr:hypothetical protein [Micromonospora sp. NBC_01796]WSA83088.1 hypothetical protein OIE47_22015 [Micromonospora sp. NBC_01796]